jgi:hypothetical protein
MPQPYFPNRVPDAPYQLNYASQALQPNTAAPNNPAYAPTGMKTFPLPMGTTPNGFQPNAQPFQALNSTPFPAVNAVPNGVVATYAAAGFPSPSNTNFTDASAFTPYSYPNPPSGRYDAAPNVQTSYLQQFPMAIAQGGAAYQQSPMQPATVGNGSDLNQFTQTGRNIVQSNQHQGSVDLRQIGINAINQQANFNNVMGDFKLSQLGNAQQGNTVRFSNVEGQTKLRSSNEFGNVVINGTRLQGAVDIDSEAFSAGGNQISLSQLLQGGHIATIGNSTININDARDALRLNLQGIAGQTENFNIKLNNIQSAEDNFVVIDGNEGDTATIDLTGNQNGSEIFTRGNVDTLNIQGKNNQADTIFTQANTKINIDLLDDMDTIVVRQSDGKVSTKTVQQLRQMKLDADPRNNFMMIDGQKTPVATVDLSARQYGTEVFTKNGVQKVQINGKNNQKDTIYVEGSAQVDFATLDDMDVVVTRMSDGTVVGKTVKALKDLQNPPAPAPTPAPAPAPAPAPVAAPALPPILTPKQAAQALRDNFGAFENISVGPRWHEPGVTNFDQLVAYTQQPNADPVLKAAAQYFIDHRAETFDIMEGLNDRGRRDGVFSPDEMNKFYNQV